MKFSFLHSTYFSDTYPDEWDAVQKHFPLRSDGVDSLPSGTVVIPRYRAIPFGAELEAHSTGDLQTMLDRLVEQALAG